VELRQSQRALQDSEMLRRASSAVLEELDRLREEQAMLQAENDRRRQWNAQLEHRLAATSLLARGSLSVHDHMQELSQALFVALCVGVAQGALGVFVYVCWTSVAKHCAPVHHRHDEYYDEFDDFNEDDRHPLSCCSCSKSTLLYAWVLLLFMDLGFATLWHYGMVQPVLGQLVVIVYFGAAFFAILFLILREVWITLKAKVKDGMKVVRFIHEKTDWVLDHLGLHDPTDPRHQEKKKQSTLCGEPCNAIGSIGGCADSGSDSDRPRSRSEDDGHVNADRGPRRPSERGGGKTAARSSRQACF